MRELLKFYDEFRWQTVEDFEEPQLLMWVPYYNLEDFTEQYKDYFEVENEIMANLQRDHCLINISDLFGQEDNEVLEEIFPKTQSIKDGWVK